MVYFLRRIRDVLLLEYLNIKKDSGEKLGFVFS